MNKLESGESVVTADSIKVRLILNKSIKPHSKLKLFKCPVL